jgi:hypothetical protein
MILAFCHAANAGIQNPDLLHSGFRRKAGMTGSFSSDITIP